MTGVQTCALPISVALLAGASAAAEAVELERGATQAQTIILTPDQFVPDASTYYGAALEGLRRVVAGEPVERFFLRS